MIEQIDFKKHRFAVIGLGDTGISIIKYLQYEKANLIKIFDTREDPPHRDIVENYELYCGKLNIKDFSDIDVIVISPGVSIYETVLQIAITQGKLVVGDVELFARVIKSWPSHVIGITGSNGKTTVTTLTGYLAQKAGFSTLVAGNIGVPVLHSYIEIIKSGAIPQFIVLELSSFQLETIQSLNLTTATVLNISEDHLDRYRDLLEYAYAKAHIFNNCQLQILNNDDLLVKAMARSNQKHVWFGYSEALQYKVVVDKENSCLNINNTSYLLCKDLQLVGQHNYQNVLASLALLAGCGIDINDQVIKNALKEFKGLEHRMQKVGIIDDVIYIEDSKGTNVGAVVAGVSGLDQWVHLILGGDGKGQDFTPLRELVKKFCKSVAILGQDKHKIYKVLDGLDTSVKLCDSLEECVEFCHNNALPNEYVVLSPACASWDMFNNYKHRADVFVKCVESLKKTG